MQMIMKLKTLLALAALLMLPVAINAQVPQGGPGLAVAGSLQPSQLPEKAQKFLTKYYPNQTCVSLMKDYEDNEYELRMSDGTQVTFRHDGTIDDIEAPRGQILPMEVVKAILPEKSFNHLNANGYLGLVEEIDYGRKGYEVGLRGNSPDEITYAVTGELVEIDY